MLRGAGSAGKPLSCASLQLTLGCPQDNNSSSSIGFALGIAVWSSAVWGQWQQWEPRWGRCLQGQSPAPDTVPHPATCSLHGDQPQPGPALGPGPRRSALTGTLTTTTALTVLRSTLLRFTPRQRDWGHASGWHRMGEGGKGPDTGQSKSLHRPDMSRGHILPTPGLDSRVHVVVMWVRKVSRKRGMQKKNVSMQRSWWVSATNNGYSMVSVLLSHYSRCTLVLTNWA